jgi:hypothetical protein
VLSHGQALTTLGNTMAFLCLAKVIIEALEDIDSTDRSDQFLRDLDRWELLFNSKTDRHSFREAISLMWSAQGG